MATPLLLDGGMGHQLKVMGIKIEGEVGSVGRFLGVSLANSREPQLVIDAHLAFMKAGADVITTNNYGIIPGSLRLCSDYAGDSDEVLNAKVRELIADAGKAARAAVTQQQIAGGRTVRVAGCMPPLGASYRADQVGAYEANLRQYRIIAASIAPFSDLLLCETMSTADEAKAACVAACECDGGKRPVWVSWTLSEDAPVLRSGESISDALKALGSVGLLGGRGQESKVAGFLFNCTSPEIISKAIPLLVADAQLPAGATVGAYANGFVTATGGPCNGEYRDLNPEEYQAFARCWLDAGASVVGGCCGVFPHHIAGLRKEFDDRKA